MVNSLPDLMLSPGLEIILVEPEQFGGIQKIVY